MSTDESNKLKAWVSEAENGTLSWSELAERILRTAAASGSETTGSHHPDTDRRRRCGFGEVIFGSGKSAEDIVAIAKHLIDNGQEEVLATRVDEAKANDIVPEFKFARFDPQGRTLRLSQKSEPVSELLVPCPAPPTHIAVVTAGSTDLPVAREAVETLHWMKIPVSLTTDVGVAGPYRLLAHIEHIRSSRAVVVVAGMEGALASVVGGLVSSPVIAVPTSVGYGASFEGITTLLSMMTSCAAGVAAVNIDAGFKGGYIAGLIAAERDRPDTPT